MGHNKDIEFRAYQAADHEAVWELHNIGLTHAGAHPGNGEWDEDLNQIEKVYLNNGGAFVVGIYNDCLVAMGGIQRTNETTGDVTKMRVHPYCQGFGFGQKLLSTLLAEAKRLGLKKLTLDTTTVQKRAHELYRKNGFKEVKKIQRYVAFESIVFEKELD